MKLSQTRSKQQKAPEPLKVSYSVLESRKSSDEEEIPTDPSIVKTEIFKNLDDNNCISQITIGANTFTSICLTPDEKYVVVGNNRGAATIIDIETKQEVHQFKLAHPSLVVYLAATKDNKLVACTKDGCVECFDIQTHKVQTQELGSPISAAVLTADDKYLVVGHADRSIQVWDLAQNTGLQTVQEAHTGTIHSLAVTKDNKFIVSGSGDKSISIWTFESCSLVHCFKNAHFGGVQVVRLSDDGQTIYSSCMNGAINIWDIQTKKNSCRFVNAHVQAIKGLALLGEGRFILSASTDNTIGVWDAQTYAHLHTFKGQTSFGSVVATSDSKYAVVTGEKGLLSFIKLGASQEAVVLKDAHDNTIGDIKVSNDGNFIVTGADDGRIRVWNINGTDILQEYKKEGVEVSKFALSQDDKTIAVAFNDGSIDLYSLAEKKVLLTYDSKTRKATKCLIFTRDCNKLIYSPQNQHILFHDRFSADVADKIENAHQAFISALDTTKDDKYLISGSKDKSIAIWELATKKLFHRFDNAHDSTICALKFTSNYQYLISGASDSTIKMWNFETRRLVHVFQTSHEAIMTGFDMSPNDTFLISTDLNCNVSMYNLKIRQRILVFDALKGDFSVAVAFKKDSKHVLIPRGKSIHVLEHPFYKLTVQYSDDCSPYSLLKFMPLTSYFSTSSVAERQNLIKAYPDLMLHPFGWNWFHIVSLFTPNKEMIQTCLDNKILYTVDMYGKTPLHYLLDNDEAEVASVNLIMAKFPVILENSQDPLNLLKQTGNILFQILALDNQHVINLLDSCPVEPEPEVGASLDNFGDIKSDFYLSDVTYYNQNAKQSLISAESKKKISIHMLPFEWDYSITSEYMRTLVNTLRDVNLQGIFETSTVSILIKYLWNCSKNYFYFLGILFSIQSLLISVYTGLEEDNVGLSIPIFIIAMFFLVYEIFEMRSGGLQEYFRSIWNYVDVVGAILVPGTLIATWAGMEGDTKNWLFSFIVSFTYIRWVSYLRVFKQMRQLIRMIIEIIKEMRSFALILTFVVFGLSLIFTQFDREQTYGEHLLDAYKLLYSDFDTDDAPPAKIFYLIILLVFVCIVLLNMLVTIMGDTFGDVKERGVIVDSKELLELISECSKMNKIVSSFLTKKEAYVDKLTKKYLFYVEERVEKEENYEQDKLEDDIKNLKDAYDKQEVEIDRQASLIEEQNKMIYEMSLLVKNLHASTKMQTKGIK